VPLDVSIDVSLGVSLDVSVADSLDVSVAESLDESLDASLDVDDGVAHAEMSSALAHGSTPDSHRSSPSSSCRRAGSPSASNRHWYSIVHCCFFDG